jgi:SpoVK/Ycf46/Vps4 family AAA+-type ATPase
LGKERGRNVVAECCGQILTVEDIAQLTKGYSGADSARIAEEYIQDWAVELLMYETSHRVSNRKIEEVVADYRRSLYMHEYEQLLVAQRMPLMIEDTLISAFYETHRQQLILREMILKGALVVVPNGAPNMGDLRKHLGKLDDSESLEWIEKYVYQYGVGYELFVEDWKLCEEVLDCMPLEKTELSKLVRKNKQVELQDSINTYMLEVVDYYPAGGVMPLDYARKDIEMNILRTRRTEFLDSMRNELYDKSIKNGKLKRYEK